MKAIRAAIIGFALCAATVESRAAELCALYGDLTTLQTAAIQQSLMVSALACNEASSYNAFVLGHQKELQKSDRDLQGFFTRLNSATGIGDYHAYKTRLANAYSLLSAQHKEEYCALTRAVFERSQSGSARSLREFILAQPLVFAIGYRSCGELVGGDTFTTPTVKRTSVPASGGVTSGPAQQLRQAPPAFWDQRRYDGSSRRETRKGSDYFYDGRSFRRLYSPYTDSFWRR